jgi:hypothetical protein
MAIFILKGLNCNDFWQLAGETLAAMYDLIPCGLWSNLSKNGTSNRFVIILIAGCKLTIFLLQKQDFFNKSFTSG